MLPPNNSFVQLKRNVLLKNMSFLGLCQTSKARHAPRHAPSAQRNTTKIQLERGRSFIKHIRKRRWQTDLPQASSSSKYRLYKGQSGFHKGIARVGGLLVDEAAGHTCSCGGGDSGGTPAFGGVPEFGGEYGYVVGLGFR